MLLGDIWSMVLNDREMRVVTRDKKMTEMLRNQGIQISLGFLVIPAV